MKKITLVGLKNMSMEEIKNLIEDDIHMVHDIEITLENERLIYEQLKKYTISLHKKQEKEIYNYSLAVKGMLNIVDKGIKEYYIKPFYAKNTTISNLLSVNDRIIIARNLLDDFIEKSWN